VSAVFRETDDRRDSVSSRRRASIHPKFLHFEFRADQGERSHGKISLEKTGRAQANRGSRACLLIARNRNPHRQTGGAGAPGLGISGIDLTSAIPRGLGKANQAFCIYVEQARVHSYWTQASHLGMLYSRRARVILLQKRHIGYKSVAHLKERALRTKTRRKKGEARNCRDLLKWTEESNQIDASGPPTLAAKTLATDRRSLARNKAGGRRRWAGMVM